jgi:hypothetical protein
LNDRIAASRRLAAVAIITRVIVSVVATFARAEYAIAAARIEAIVEAGVGVILIAIVAAFKTYFTFSEVVASNGVAATRQNAAAQATVVVGIVGVVTGLGTCITCAEVVAYNTIAANRVNTSARAAVIVFVIAIVAAFKTDVFGAEVAAQYAVAAEGYYAAGSALIFVENIAIVALFFVLDDAVAAICRDFPDDDLFTARQGKCDAESKGLAGQEG